MKISIIYILISVVGSAAGQLLLKKGMNTMGPVTVSLNQLPAIIWGMVTNLNVILGLGIYLVGTFFWLAALSRVDLSFAYPFASFQYIVLLILPWLLFGESMTVGRIIGTIVIGVGIIILTVK